MPWPFAMSALAINDAMSDSAAGRHASTTARVILNTDRDALRLIQPWPEALAPLEKLGAVNNHRCVSC
jgi:hypothetical protein